MSENLKHELERAAHSLIGTDVLILTHKNPDADAVGSALALAELIRTNGGHARPVCGDPIPPRLDFLAGDEDFTYTSGAEEGKTLIAVDVASPAQLGALGHLADRVTLSIDHHAVNTPYARTTVCDPSASSAGEVLYRIANILCGEDSPLSPNVARFLYAAISSDTGSFKYSNVSPETHRVAAELSEIINSASDGGYDTADIARLLFDTHTHAELLGNALAARNLTLSGDGKLAFTLITSDDCERSGITMDDCATAVDIVRSVAGVLAGVCIKEKSGGEYRLSARSNCGFDVAKVCAAFGGGGHVRAAGASVFADSPHEAEAKVKDAFCEAMEVYDG